MNHTRIPGLNPERIEQLPPTRKVRGPPRVHRGLRQTEELHVVPQEAVAQNLAAAERHRTRVHTEQAYQFLVGISGVLHVRSAKGTAQPVGPEATDEVDQAGFDGTAS